ncbi:MAG: hypothetical protein D6693_07580 [Planctomycetota bacterium]|nr:MAG: hypothetical protein D6693_07580 [Planctomycetota bacterium]
MPADPPKDQLEPIAAVLAAVLPGLGHLSLGQPVRAAWVFVGVMGLFFGGIFIGGIDTIDRKEDFWWFTAQAGVGPVAFAVDRVNQSWVKIPDPDAEHGVRSPGPDESPRARKSLGHANEIGALWAAIAGMLNVICILDCLWHTPRPVGAGGSRRRRADTPAPGAQA